MGDGGHQLARCVHDLWVVVVRAAYLTRLRLSACVGFIRHRRKAQLNLDENLFRHPKKKNVDVQDTSLEVYRGLVESGAINELQVRCLGWLRAYRDTVGPEPPTTDELASWLGSRGEIPEEKNGKKIDARAYVARILPQLRDAGLVVNPWKRPCTVNLTEAGEGKNILCWALVDGERKKIKKVPLPNKKFFPEMLKSLRDSLILLYRLEVSGGGNLESWEKKHHALLAMKDYLVYRTQAEGRGLHRPSVQKERKREQEEAEASKEAQED